MIIVNHYIVWSVAKLSELTLPCNTHLGGPSEQRRVGCSCGFQLLQNYNDTLNPPRNLVVF